MSYKVVTVAILRGGPFCLVTELIPIPRISYRLASTKLFLVFWCLCCVVCVQYDTRLPKYLGFGSARSSWLFTVMFIAWLTCLLFR